MKLKADGGAASCFGGFGSGSGRAFKFLWGWRAAASEWVPPWMRSIHVIKGPAKTPTEASGRNVRRRVNALGSNPIGLTGFDVKPPAAEGYLTALVLRRRDRRHGCIPRWSIREFDVLVENDDSLLVAHDVVAVQAVSELVEIVFALRAFVASGGKDGGADLVGLSRPRLVDRG
jgi:hypothetical protein